MSHFTAGQSCTSISKSSLSIHTVIKVPVADDATSVHWSSVMSDELWSFEDSSIVQLLQVVMQQLHARAFFLGDCFLLAHPVNILLLGKIWLRKA